MTLQNNSSPSFHDRFNQVATKNSEESYGEFFGRNLAQNTARVAETYIGLPGNTKKAFKQARDYLESFMPQESPNLSELESQLPKSDKDSFSQTILNPPTSGELREKATKKISEKLTGDKEYLEPRGEGEKATGESTQDLTSFFLPGNNRLNLLTKIGAPIAGNLVKQGLKYFGVEENTAEKAKLGIMLATSLAGQSNPAQFARDRIGQAKQMIPDGVTVFSQPLFQNLTGLSQRVRRGLGVPSKSRTASGIDDLMQQADPQGRIPLRNLMDARDDINEWISEAGGFDVPAATRDRTIANLNQLKGQIIDAIDSNMQQRFPQAAELYRTGYEASAVTHQSNTISNFIQTHFGKHLNSTGAKLLFPAALGGASLVSKGAAIGAAAYPIYKTGQVLYRINQSPTLARYYNDVLVNSSIGNAPAMIKSMEKLDKALKHDEEKQRKKNVSLQSFKERFKSKG